MKCLSSFLSVVVMASLGVGAVAACSTSKSDVSAGGFCDCVTTSFVQLQLPSGERTDVSKIVASGPACTGPVDTCDPVPGVEQREIIKVGEAACAAVTINAGADGICHIEVDFGHRSPFITDVSFSTPPNPECGGVCARRPVGLDGGTLAVPDEPLATPTGSPDAGASH